MENLHDLARIGYVIQNYDNVIEGNEQSVEYKNSDNTMAKTVVLQKKVGDGYYYVVEAMPDSKAKTLFVVSAYINKNDTFKKQRIDKVLSNLGYGSRSELKKICKNGLVKVNGKVINNPGVQVDVENDEIIFDGEKVTYKEFIYLMLNKPDGYISATFDKRDPIVLDLIDKEDLVFEPFPVGRLDKDTSGLLLLTNNGQLNHRLLSPKYKVSRVYFVEVTILDHAFNEEDIENLAQGVALNSEENVRPADLEILSDTKAKLTLYEGKYHEVKRMMHALGKEVISLKRLAYGPIELGDLKPGDLRKLGNEEVEALFKEVNLDTTEL